MFTVSIAKAEGRRDPDLQCFSRFGFHEGQVSTELMRLRWHVSHCLPNLDGADEIATQIYNVACDVARNPASTKGLITAKVVSGVNCDRRARSRSPRRHVTPSEPRPWQSEECMRMKMNSIFRGQERNMQLSLWTRMEEKENSLNPKMPFR